jgi:hypothetical protein
LTGISIAALAATGVTNAYAIQQLGLSDINYFAGKMGVGTNSPATALHVTGLQGVISSANNIQLVTKFSDGGINSNMAIAFDTAATSGTTALRGFFIGKASQAFGIVRYDSAGAAGPTYDVFVSSSGQVGVGTSAPTSPLQVMGIPTYSSDSAAGSGGLTTGAIFKDSSGGLHIKL